ncbi:MAG TPA: hypothetical protein VK355_03685 [Candidatus Binatia bacterium]|nr:hypothetical protein [Candidatus Binatia bacterium]
MLQYGTLLLTFGSVLRYTARMPIHFILPKKFTRAQIEWRVDELALRFQGTKDKKLLAQIAALNRLLARMDDRDSNASNPRNRQ